jgi:hypothetical protein
LEVIDLHAITSFAQAIGIGSIEHRDERHPHPDTLSTLLLALHRPLVA